MIRAALTSALLLVSAPAAAQDMPRLFSNTRGLQPVPIETLREPDTLWLLALGQSNAANSGEAPRGIQPNVFNYFRGKIYPARDPLLGATGRGSNIWTAVATEIIQRGIAKRVVLIPLAIGATSIEQWRPDTPVGQALSQLLAGLKADGVAADFVLWQQGESDEQTRSEDYSDMLVQFRTGLAVNGQTAPMIVALASRKRRGAAPSVRAGQKSATQKSDCVFMGPDADTLFGPQNRIDGIHFTTAGQDQLATMWVDSIEAAQKQRSRCPDP